MYVSPVPTAILFPEDSSLTAKFLDFAAKKANEGGVANWVASRIVAVTALVAAAIDALVHAVSTVFKAAAWFIATPLWIVTGGNHDVAAGANAWAISAHVTRTIGYALAVAILPVVGLVSPTKARDALYSTLANEAVAATVPVIIDEDVEAAEPAPVVIEAPKTFLGRWKELSWKAVPGFLISEGWNKTSSVASSAFNGSKNFAKAHPVIVGGGATAAALLALDALQAHLRETSPFYGDLKDSITGIFNSTTGENAGNTSTAQDSIPVDNNEPAFNFTNTTNSTESATAGA